ncbi:AEC family transporter [Aliiroseovarius crassostreae]|uniref:AEC family transporter n=1 Tax=Aliiroseovarius crassostreae TaxID=154981 RepID=A0A9Q9HDM9_9RHOB|nr:AEC family transporter [Aliiroseovarius crassostreae]UWP88563.1 AEC family transporter [Aliiroseovarius crassostreae]UWP91725.1 AEC family transporter [Aliiroseovarius crassostreae]UWP94870.1 AEC family transporter [Aliiroseovarius crassostreae]UWP98033.1 AEC family transporter [Aliiroseovarius crassostreae]UWQ01217.1 AEC family transporter [Aliiroseovarius crassostreae]
MIDVLLQTLPFFALIGLGFAAAARGFFPPEATAYLTRFVFYFALSAMLFRFAANLTLSEVLNWPFIWAYAAGGAVVYALATIVALLRRVGVEEAAVEAQCAVIGNTGFLGVPMLALLLGEAAIGPVMLVLAVDLFLFGSLIVILITGHRDGRVSPAVLISVAKGLATNPMIVSIALGFAWSSTGWALPVPANRFLEILSGASTPGALFAIGASLAVKSAERLSVASWLSFAKLVLHPAAVAFFALVVFDVAAYPAGVMIAAAGLPVAGNVYILAQHYNVAPHRASAAILISTLLSILTVSAILAWVSS